MAPRVSLAAFPSARYANAGAPSGAAATFSARAVALMIAFGLVGFLGLGVLGAYAPMLRGGLQGGGDALSRSAVGFAGLVRILRESGRPVVISREASAADAGTAGLLVLTPAASVKAADIRKLVARSRRPVLLVLPKWTAVPDPRHLGWVLRAGAAPPLTVVRPLRDALPSMKGGVQVKRASGATAGLVWVGASAGGAALKTGPVAELQTAAPAEAQVLIETPQADPVLTRVLFGPYVLSEPDLLDNQAMATPQGAQAAVAILDRLRAGTGPILFDVTLNGYGRPRSLVLLALTPPFLGASLTALATALLMGGRAAVRFGPRAAAGAHASPRKGGAAGQLRPAHRPGPAGAAHGPPLRRPGASPPRPAAPCRWTGRPRRRPTGSTRPSTGSRPTRGRPSRRWLARRRQRSTSPR